MGNGFPGLSEANKFLPVDADRIGENTASIDDSNRLVMAEKDLIFGRAKCLLRGVVWNGYALDPRSPSGPPV